MKKIKLVIFEALFIILSLLISQQAFALKCVSGGKSDVPFNTANANTKHVTPLGNIKIIKFKESDVVVWQADHTVTLTCYDDTAQNDPNSENVFMWFDDSDNGKGKLAAATKNTNVEIAVISNGEETNIDGNQTAKDMKVIGIKHTDDDEAKKSNCDLIKKESEKGCADPQTISLSYSLLIKSKSTKSNINQLQGGQTYQVFQIDGSGGRNNTGNFTEWIKFGRIDYIDCLPNVFTDTVDLGVFPRSSPLNVPLGRKKFPITIDLYGEQCANETFKLRWVPSGKINDSTIQTDRKNVGIQIFAEGKENPYEYGAGKNGNEVFFERTTGNSISKTFEAGVIFIKKPKTGDFIGSANFVLTVK